MHISSPLQKPPRLTFDGDQRRPARPEGQLLSKDTADPAEFKKAAAVWQGDARAVPAHIAFCVNTADVKQCVDWARDHRDVPVAVVSGGHSFSGKSQVRALFFFFFFFGLVPASSSGSDRGPQPLGLGIVRLPLSVLMSLATLH